MRDRSCQRCSDSQPQAPPPAESPVPEPRPSFVARLRRKLYRPLVLLAVGLIPMGFVVVGLVRKSLPDLGTRPEYRLSADRVALVDPPGWIPKDFTAHVLEESGVLEEFSLLDDELVRAVSRAFDVNPWVAHVESVRKTATGRIELRLEFREPVAMVRIRRVSYPVDSEGVLLPAADFTTDVARELPTITGIATDPVASGQAWDDPVLRGAAGIARSLREPWGDLGLASVRVNVSRSRGKPADDLVYELVTTGGSRILWGRAPGSQHPGELSVRQKLGKLTSYLERFESFEKPNGPYEIDIRHWRETTRQRIAAAATVDRS